MNDLFEPGVAGGADLLLLDGLRTELTREGMTELSHWPGGIRASGRVRSKTFGVLHLKHQKNPRRLALVRQAVLRLLEQRARTGFSDELCLVTDSDIDVDSSNLLSSAGIEWRWIEAATHTKKKVIAGTRSKHIALISSPAPVSIEGTLRGAGKHRAGSKRVGYGAGYVTARMRLSGTGEIELPGTFGVVPSDNKYQSGILIIRVRVKLDVDMELDLFCLNREARPASIRSIFKAVVFANERRFSALSDFLRDKVVSTKAARNLIQQAVWELAEDKKVRKDTQEELDDLATQEMTSAP